MTKREVVALALKGKPVPYTPWSFRSTVEAKDALAEHYSGSACPLIASDAVSTAGVDLGRTQVRNVSAVQPILGAIERIASHWEA